MIPEQSMMSTRGVFSLLSLAAAVVLIYFAIRLVRHSSEQKFIPLFFLAAALFNVFIFIISAGNVTGRYFIPFMIFYIPITAIGFVKSEKTFGHIKRAAIFSAALIFVFGTAFLNYRDLPKNNRNATRKGYITYLLENHLDYGFATFWNANVTTELSNEVIEIAALPESSLDKGSNNFHLNGWLSKKEFRNKNYHAGESFLLLTKEELEKAKAAGRAFAHNTPSYEDNDFIVMRFPSAQFIHEYIMDDDPYAF